MTKKKSHVSRPYIIAASFFVILFVLMKVQDVRTQTTAKDPFERIESQTSNTSVPRGLASLPQENFGSKVENEKSDDLKTTLEAADGHLQVVEQRRAQVKAALFGLFMMQRTFQAEHNRFTSDMAMMNHDFPEQLGFKFGFSNAFSPEALAEGERPNSSNTDFLLGEPLSKGRTARLLYKADASEIKLQNYLHFCHSKCEVTENSFEAIAVMPVPGGNDVDVFLVNERKEIFHVYNGITKKGLTN